MILKIFYNITLYSPSPGIIITKNYLFYDYIELGMWFGASDIKAEKATGLGITEDGHCTPAMRIGYPMNQVTQVTKIVQVTSLIWGHLDRMTVAAHRSHIRWDL